MKQRRTILILGAVAVTLVMASIGLALYFLHALEKEKNRKQMQPALDKRWPKGQEKVEESQQTELPNEIIDTPVPNMQASL